MSINAPTFRTLGVAVAAGAVVLSLTTAGAAFARGGEDPGNRNGNQPGLVIKACVDDRGTLRLPTEREHCRGGREVSWNQQGPQGEQGRQGVPGPQGRQGEPGRPGTTETKIFEAETHDTGLQTLTVRCRGGKVLGGGFRTDAARRAERAQVLASFPSNETEWTVTVDVPRQNGGRAPEVKAFAVCTGSR